MDQCVMIVFGLPTCYNHIAKVAFLFWLRDVVVIKTDVCYKHNWSRKLALVI